MTFKRGEKCSPQQTHLLISRALDALSIKHHMYLLILPATSGAKSQIAKENTVFKKIPSCNQQHHERIREIRQREFLHVQSQL